MTAAVKAQLLAHGAKLPAEPRNIAPKPRKPAPRPDVASAAQASLVAAVTEPDTTPPPSVAATHYIGRYQLNVANGTHYPGRARYVVTGPASQELTAALVAALTHFTNQP